MTNDGCSVTVTRGKSSITFTIHQAVEFRGNSKWVPAQLIGLHECQGKLKASVRTISLDELMVPIEQIRPSGKLHVIPDSGLLRRVNIRVGARETEAVELMIEVGYEPTTGQMYWVRSHSAAPWAFMRIKSIVYEDQTDEPTYVMDDGEDD